MKDGLDENADLARFTHGRRGLVKIKQWACKPGSVPSCEGVCHLSRPAVTCRLERPTPRHRAGSPTCAGVHGLATHEMYGPPVLPSERWALTPPFHPYLFAQAVVFCYMVFALADNFPLGSMVPCVARTFLFQVESDRPAHCLRQKYVNSVIDRSRLPKFSLP
jgi:hypothetical protein